MQKRFEGFTNEHGGGTAWGLTCFHGIFLSALLRYDKDGAPISLGGPHGLY